MKYYKRNKFIELVLQYGTSRYPAVYTLIKSARIYFTKTIFTGTYDGGPFLIPRGIIPVYANLDIAYFIFYLFRNIISIHRYS